MLENKKAFFGVDASKVEIKKLLNKEFLELSLKAISDEKPNRNDTWFTKESLENCKDTVYNKPVLGFFKNNDFVSHNGKWSKDEELDMEYWDTMGEGERCIGLIRESDNVEIIQDRDGLNWLTFSCAIWTQYSYKQVKRLLKDAIKAQKEGGPTKNISVEVNLTDYEEIYDPVSGKDIVKINSFELVGVTILGSRNGVKVEPGIEGAELSVVDIMDTALYNTQVKNLRIAYEKLGDTKTNIIKEDASMPIENEKNIVTTQTEETPVVTQFEENVDTIEPVIETQDPQVNPITEETPAVEHFENTESTEVVTETVENTEVTETVVEETPANAVETFEADPVYDLTWLIGRCHDLTQYFTDTLGYYKEYGVQGAEYILAILEKNAKILALCCKDLAEALAKVCAEDYEDNVEEIEHEKDMCNHCDCVELYSQFEAKTKEYNELMEKSEQFNNKVKELEEKIATYSDYEELQNKVKAFEMNALLAEAETFVTTAELSEEKATQVYEDCKSGKYANADEVKAAVALMAFEAKPKIVKTMYQAPVQKTPVVIADGDPETPKAKSGWDVLKDYNSGK